MFGVCRLRLRNKSWNSCGKYNLVRIFEFVGCRYLWIEDDSARNISVRSNSTLCKFDLKLSDSLLELTLQSFGKS